MLNALLITLAGMQAGSTAQEPGARSPSWSADGRVAFAAGGDLWVVEGLFDAAPAAPVRITRGASWDRDPSWAGPDALLYASDRAGGLDIWRVRLGPGGPAEPERMTHDPEPETDPVALPDGSIVFVRGGADASDMWRAFPDGREVPVTRDPGGDFAPAVSPDGTRVAWIAQRLDGTEVRVLDLASQDEEAFEAGGAMDVAWSPEGDRLAVAIRGTGAGIWVSAPDGSARVLVSESVGPVTWSPDGSWLLLGAEIAADAGYNGDPDRVPDREATGGSLEPGTALRAVRVPTVPGPAVEVPLRLSIEATEFTAEFDRVWQRISLLYTPRGTAASDAGGWTRRWEAARARHRPDARSATSPEALDEVIHALLRDRPPVREPAIGRAAVSSAHPAATAAGVEILEAGGNVVDAAVAVSFAIGVVEPDASGIGGYGEMLIHLEGMAEPVAIEFMTRHPEAIEEVTPGQQRLEGPRRVNVPGTVAGMELAWRKYGSGTVSWARVLAPAIRLADHGFPVSDGLATTLRREWLEFSKHEESRSLFFPGDRPLSEGDTLRNPDLARTLTAIAEGGAAAFYQGDIARRIVADLSAAGNPVRESDFAQYIAVERRPVRTTYRGHAIFAGPPPVTGGAVLAGKLNLLELTEPGRSMTDDPVGLHAMIEAWKLQPSTGGRIADPDLWPVDVTPFESKDTAVARWRCFDPERATTTARILSGCGTEGSPGRGPFEGSVPDPGARADSGTDGGWPHAADGHPEEECGPGSGVRCRSTGTTAFAVADADGNAVSVTQTLGTWGGNFYVTPGLGFLYNDKATSFRGNPDAFGAARPFGRVGTVISPAIVFDGTDSTARPMLAVGAAGNAWITSAVYMAVVGVIDHGLGPQAALELPRMLVGGGGRGGNRETMIQIEDGFSPAALRQLEAMGHRFRRISLRGELRMGYGAAVLVRGGQAIAGADPRRAGAAGAVR